MKNLNIPVFYHVPKNSGTYMYINIFNTIRNIYPNINCREITAMDGIYISIRLIVNDDLFFLDSCDLADFSNKNLRCDCIKNCIHKRIWKIDIQNINAYILNNLKLLGVIIEPRGFKCSEKICEYISNLFREYCLHRFILLRNPFEREQSLFNYLTSKNSKHEPTHGIIKSNTFEEYIMSNQLQDSWLIRNLLNLKNNEVLNEEHYIKVCELLKGFNVYDTKDTKKCLEEMLLKCFGNVSVKNSQIKINQNTNSYLKINFKDLPENVQNTFKTKKYWDQKLYDNLFSKNISNL